MKIILTGATGLIGSRFEEILFETHEIIPLSSSHGVDITDKNSISEFLKNKEFDAVIHLAAKTDVDGCELDKNEDMQLLEATENSLKNLDIFTIEPLVFRNKKTAAAINILGTRNLYEVAKEKNAKFIYISTDFVFAGNGTYDEESEQKPINWYGMTKWYGEKVVNTSNDLIVRLSFPYGYESSVKRDLVWKLHDLLRDRAEVSLISDQTITPTFIDDIVYGLDFLLQEEAYGIYHITGSSSHSPLEIGQKIRDAFGFTTTITPSSLEKIYEGKARRPFKSIMKNDKIINLGYTPKTLDEVLRLIANT